MRFGDLIVAGRCSENAVRVTVNNRVRGQDVCSSDVQFGSVVFMFLKLLNRMLESRLFKFQSQIKGFTRILLAHYMAFFMLL